MPGIIREHNVVAVASWVKVCALRLGILRTKDLPQLIEDIAGNAVADILRDRLNFPVKNLAGSTVRLAGGKLDGIIPIPEMVDKLDQNAGLYTLADRDEPEQDIFHRGSVLTTAQSEVQIPGKHTGTKHKMRRQQFRVDRRLHQFLQF